MVFHAAGAVLCLVFAAVFAMVLWAEQGVLPGWVIGLASVATLGLLVGAWKLVSAGLERRRILEGPRTKIVIADVPPPPAKRSAKSGRS